MKNITKELFKDVSIYFVVHLLIFAIGYYSRSKLSIVILTHIFSFIYLTLKQFKGNYVFVNSDSSIKNIGTAFFLTLFLFLVYMNFKITHYDLESNYRYSSFNVERIRRNLGIDWEYWVVIYQILLYTLYLIIGLILSGLKTNKNYKSDKLELIKLLLNLKDNDTISSKDFIDELRKVINKP